MAKIDQKPVTAMSVKIIAKLAFDESGDIRGELDCVYYEKPFVFTGILSMIKMMEATFDSKGFPEKQMLPRVFRKAKKRLEKHEMDLSAYLRAYAKDDPDVPVIHVPDGKTCVFEIFVKSRYNAEWQGSIHRVDKGLTKEFLSIMELIRLIDCALKECGKVRS